MTRVAPAKVRKEAKLGLMLHKKWKRGGTAVGVARAVQLYSGKAVSDQTIKRMYSYFQRHQHDRLDKDGSDGKIPGKGYIAWLLWGGDSGRKWAEAEYKKIKKANPVKRNNPARNITNPERIKEFAETLATSLNHLPFYPNGTEIYDNLAVWFKRNFVKGIINSESTENFLGKVPANKVEQNNKIGVKTPEWLKKALEKGEQVYYFPYGTGLTADDVFHNITGIYFDHFIDFALSEDFPNPNNISRISFDQMWELVRQWDEKNKKIKTKKLQMEDETVYKEYPDGFKWLQLHSMDALLNESARMGGICIGTASNHYEPILKEIHSAFSLRDTEGQPRVTVEYIGEKGSLWGKPNSFREIKGYGNGKYVEYGKYVADLLVSMQNHDFLSTTLQCPKDLNPKFSGFDISIGLSSDNEIEKVYVKKASYQNNILVLGGNYAVVDLRSNERKGFLAEAKKQNPLSLIARGIDERPASAYDREELKLGIKTELEHTDDAIIASKIAKDHLDEDPHYYSKLIKMESKMKNPITSSFEKSEEYLPIVQKVVSKASKGTDAWIDETTGDILVGTMAFDEDRSFDDVLIRIKTNGQIKEGESVDKSIKKSVQDLMKKIHMVLAEYVVRKPNPSKEISEIKTNFKKLNKFFGLKKRNPSEKDIPYLSETLLSSDILLEYIILSIIKASGNSGAPLILIEKSVFEILMGGQEISEAGKGLNESAKDKLEMSLYVKIMRMINEWKRKKLNFIYERSPAKENELYSLLQKRPSDSKYYVIESDGIQYLNSIKLVIQQIIDKEEKIKDQQSIIELLSSYREKIIKMKNKGISRKIPEIDKVQEIVEEKIESKKSNPAPAGVDREEFDKLVEKLKKRKDVDNPYALANWILKQKNPTAYEKLVKQLQAKGVDDPKALAAWIGREKYGKEEFQRRAAAGRRKKSNPSSDIKKDFDEILKDKSHD